MRAFAVPIHAKLVALALGCSLFAACSGSSSTGSGIAFKGGDRGTEDQGSIMVLFERIPIALPFGLEVGSTSLDYSTESGTAESGVDFVATSGTLAWGKGHDGTRAIEVVLIDDSEVEGSEEFVIRFSNNSEPLKFGNPLTIRIEDDDDGTPVRAGMTLTYVIEIGEDGEVRLVRVGVEADGEVGG